VVCALQANDDPAGGLAGDGAGDPYVLESAVDGLRAACGEEDAGVGHRRAGGQRGRQLLGRLIGEAVEGVERRQRAQLRAHRVGDLAPAVADVAEPQAGHRVPGRRKRARPGPGRGSGSRSPSDGRKGAGRRIPTDRSPVPAGQGQRHLRRRDVQSRHKVEIPVDDRLPRNVRSPQRCPSPRWSVYATVRTGLQPL
jgi:hypothetical protein